MIVREKISLKDLGEFVKIVADVKRKTLAVKAEMHVDLLDELVKEGSKWEDCWGANVYPKTGEIQFDSMINVKPRVNASIEILDESIRKQVREVIDTFIT